MNDREIRFSDMNDVGEESNVRSLKQSDILKCPFVIMVAEHYRTDGSCKCDDPEHRAMMIAEWEYTEDDFKGAR